MEALGSQEFRSAVMSCQRRHSSVSLLFNELSGSAGKMSSRRCHSQRMWWNWLPSAPLNFIFGWSDFLINSFWLKIEIPTLILKLADLIKTLVLFYCYWVSYIVSNLVSFSFAVWNFLACISVLENKNLNAKI